MQECPGCGIRNEDSRAQCFRCGTELPRTAPPIPAPAPAPPAQPPGGAPNRQVPAPNDYNAYVPYQPPQTSGTMWAPPAQGVDEGFIDQFSWGPGCGLYYWSRAMIYFLLGSVAINGLSKILFPNSEDPNADPATPAEGLMAIILLVALIMLMYYAGKVARRRRWEMLKWRDFEQFRRDELQWDSAGKIGWAIFVLVIVGSFISGLLRGINGGG